MLPANFACIVFSEACIAPVRSGGAGPGLCAAGRVGGLAVLGVCLGVSERSYPNSRGWSAFLNDRWPALIGLAAGTLGLIDDGIDGSEVTTPLAVVTLVMAAAYLPIGAYRRQLGDPKVLLVETVGVLAFGALALGALLAEGRLAQYLLAAAWLGHGAWDFAHHRVDKVVPRWYAELCAVLDVMVAIGILLAVPHL